MSFLIKSAIKSRILNKASPILMTAVRNHWNKDYKPGPYPKTEEERVKAAKKYGLLPQEYEAYPDDGFGYGDYPKLPLRSADEKSNFYPWDYPELKRNFQEPLHVEFDLVREDRYNCDAKLRYPLWMYWAQFFGVLGGLFAVYALFEKIKCYHPVAPRQYPNKVHYTFEPKE